jgi:hypothetical protein
MSQFDDYSTFHDLGPRGRPPRDYNSVRVHLVFKNVKHDLRRKARRCANGSTTAPPKDSVYSCMVSLRSLRLCTFLAEFNGLSVEAADVGNA